MVPSPKYFNVIASGSVFVGDPIKRNLNTGNAGFLGGNPNPRDLRFGFPYGEFMGVTLKCDLNKICVNRIIQ